MMTTSRGARNNPKKDELVSGFLGGLNTFQDETLIKDSELTEAKNILLDVDGIQPRPGTDDYSNSSDSTVLGGIGYYNSDGTREFLRMSGGKLKKYSSGTPTAVDTDSYSTTADANFVQGRDKVFIFNGVQNLSYYDGSTITSYTSVNTPALPTVTPTGTTGATDYSYRISAFNAVGETLASTATAVTNGTSTLSTSNYNRVSWASVAGATGYNVWGREATGLGETYLDTTYTTAYNDQGARDPSTTLLPPESNTTTGVIATMGIFAISRIFAAGDPSFPSRLYYSDVGTKLGQFAIGADSQAGWVDVFRNDGSQIRAIAPFQGGVIVWKDNAIYKFTFTTITVNGTTASAPQLEEITRSFGGISFRGVQAVENDIVFPAKKDGRLAFYSLGNQENYAGSVLRTNELSIKIAEQLSNVAVDRLPNTAAFYFDSIYGCAVSKSGSSTNDRIWCLDTRFGAWTYWEGFNPRFFMTYEDTSGNVNLYYGNESSGYMTQMFTTNRNDNDTAISVQFTTKSFNQKRFNKIKKYLNPTFQFKEVNQSGALNGEIYLDGAILQSGFSVNQQITGGAGTGVSLPGFTLPGEADGGISSTTGVSSDIIVEVRTVKRARSIKYNFSSSTANLFYKFLSLNHTYEVLDGKRLPSSVRTYPTG